jgi:hypothetical protein
VGEPAAKGVTSNLVMRRIQRSQPLVLVAALALLLLATACGDDDQATRTTDDTSPPTGDGGGGGDGDLVVSLDVHGGFVPVERAVADTADTVLVGDGTVLSPAPTIAIFPGPALVAFQVGRVDPAEVEELAAAIEALDPEADYRSDAEAQIADAPETTVSVLRGGEETTSITAYALGMAGGSGPRAELAAVVERINGLTDPSGGELYEPTALRVHDVTEQAGDPPSSTTSAPEPEVPAEPSGRVLEWPLPHDGRACTVLDAADDVAAVLEVLAEATQLDWFSTDAGVRRLVVVPVLPGDRRPCEDAS